MHAKSCISMQTFHLLGSRLCEEWGTSKIQEEYFITVVSLLFVSDKIHLYFVNGMHIQGLFYKLANRTWKRIDSRQNEFSFREQSSLTSITLFEFTDSIHCDKEGLQNNGLQLIGVVFQVIFWYMWKARDQMYYIWGEGWIL